MKVVLSIVPIARGEFSKKNKCQIVGIVTDDLTKKDDKTGLYHSCQVSAPVHIDFWVIKEIALSLSVTSVPCVCDVNVIHNQMSVRVLQIKYKGEFVDVGKKEETEDEE